MKYLIATLLLVASAFPLPASATLSNVTLSQVGGGVCVDLTATGGAEIRVYVEGRPDLGFISAFFTADRKNGIRLAGEPKEGFAESTVATGKDRGRDAQGRNLWTLWVSTTADAGGVPFEVEVLEGRTVVSTHPIAEIAAGGSCAALPPPE